MKFRVLLLLLVLSVAACATPEAENEMAGPPATVAAQAQGASESDSPSPDNSSIAYGRNDDGTFFQGFPDAPVTLVDYSDFLWPTCRAHVLGAERDIVANHVVTGEVKIIYWPMLDLGPNSENAAAAAFCAGEQDPALFWAVHHALFEDQRSVYLARRDYFVDTAVAQGADRELFEACYDGEAMRETLAALDAARREVGVTQRPTFDLNGQRVLGAQPYETFAEIIAALQP